MSQRFDLNVFVDALGWTVSEPNAFLPELNATRQPVRTVLGYSSGAVPTILTGVLPNVHGQWSFFYWDPERSPFRYLSVLGMLPHRLAAHHRVRRPLSAIVQRIEGYTGYFNLYAASFKRLPYLDYCEKKDLFAPGGINGCPTILDAFREANIPYFVSDWRLPEEKNIDLARRFVRNPMLRTSFVYLPGFDAILHRHGKAGSVPYLSRYADAIRSIVHAAKQVHDEVRVWVFSDHGMADVKRQVDLMGRVESLGLVWGKDYAAVYDSTMVRLWYLAEDARGLIEDTLRAADCGRYLSDTELASMGLDFPGHKYGEAIFLCDPGVLIAPSDMGLGTIAGMHGYSEDDPDSDGVLLASHPCPIPVRRIHDINELMRAQVGLERAAGAP